MSIEQHNYRIRGYRETDGVAVRDLIQRVWTEHFGDHPDPLVREYMSQPGTLADIGSMTYSGPRSAFLVAEARDQLIGCGGIDEVDANVCEVRRMYVAPDHRRRGVARRILSALLEMATRAGYCQARLSSNKALIASHSLYESEGFRLTTSWDAEAEAYAYFFARPLSRHSQQRA